MQVNGRALRTIWKHPNRSDAVQIIDQRALPHRLVIEDLESLEDAVAAIKDMHVRGAPLIGVTAAYAMALAARKLVDENDFQQKMHEAACLLGSTRPTAVNLSWALQEQLKVLDTQRDLRLCVNKLFERADEICAFEVENCRRIGEHGFEIIKDLARKRAGKPVRILTHCNAGWLACVDYGTATAALYRAFDAGIALHVWVDETRPRNQGASLTAWELSQHGVPHAVIADNTGGLLMQRGEVDLVIVGADRVTRSGDVANKIGTYLKALAAFDNQVPFYVALPSSSFDLSMRDGLAEVPIEERDPDEVKYIQGYDGKHIVRVLLTPETSAAINYGFDITPARLVSAFICEHGVCPPTEKEIMALLGRSGS